METEITDSMRWMKEKERERERGRLGFGEGGRSVVAELRDLEPRKK